MAVADAVMQMDLSDQPFVVFRNASHGEINVVYRREDGNIGWIDPATSLSSDAAKKARAQVAKARSRRWADGLVASRQSEMGKAMHLGDFISPEAVIPSLKAKSKKQLLQELSARAARLTGLEERYIFDVLLQRERLGSTGLGQGIAIPHGKFAGLKRIVGIFARLAEPIDFDAVEASRSTSCSCCSRPKAPAPIISRRSRASRACCARAARSRSSARRRTPPRSTPCSPRKPPPTPPIARGEFSGRPLRDLAYGQWRRNRICSGR